MLNVVKLALLISTNIFDTELTNYINAALADLGLAGVEGATVVAETTDPLVICAVTSFVGYRFEQMHGALERSAAYKKSYDEQKAQLSMATGYTTWGNADE